jgi:hypothetical protein
VASLITFYNVNAAARDTSTLTTASFTPANGEVFVVTVATEGSAVPTIGTLSGGSQTYTMRNNSLVASNCGVAIYTAVVAGSPGAMTVGMTFSGNVGYHSLTLERYSNASLAATPATNTTETGTGAPSSTLTTTAANSIVSWVNGDWNAIAPGTPAYLSSAISTGVDNRSTQFYVGYHAYQTAGAAGSQTFGMSSPTGQKWSMVGIEVLDSGGTAAAVLWPRSRGPNYRR